MQLESASTPLCDVSPLHIPLTPPAMTTTTRSSAPAIILTTSALVLGALGLLLLFAPGETSEALGWGPGTVAPALAASGLLAIAVLDWMGRGAVYGGIYGRPLVLANLTLALTGGLTLVNAQLDRPDSTPLGWLPVVILAIHGVAFFTLLRGRLSGI